MAALDAIDLTSGGRSDPRYFQAIGHLANDCQQEPKLRSHKRAEHAEQQQED